MNKDRWSCELPVSEDVKAKASPEDLCFGSELFSILLWFFRVSELNDTSESVSSFLSSLSEDPAFVFSTSLVIAKIIFCFVY